FADPKNPGGGKRLEGATLYDILPTLLNRYQVEAPMGLRGQVLQM
ncbi:MAG: hypothetical protein F6K03_11135, partial [Kamptonema sp. SIO4C4]|nr:hypothetical protein [Kamptonema sp. SIO4C4]